jgi:hypothetical protein
MSAIETSVSRMASRATAALAGVFTVGAIIDMGRKALDTADALGTAAEKAQMSVEQFSALAYAAKQSDVPMDALETSIKKLSESIALAGGGNEKFMDTFKRLGVSVKDSRGQVRDTHAVLEDVASAFAKAKDGPEKVAVAMQLMGRSGEAAIPLLNKGAAAIVRLEADAERLGKTMDAQTAAAANQFHKDLDTLTDSSAALARTLAGTLLPPLDDILKSMIEGKREAGLYGAAVQGIAALFFQISNASDTMDQQLAKVNKQITETRKNISQPQPSKFFDEFSGADTKSVEELNKDLQDLIATRDKLQKQLSDRDNQAQGTRAILGQEEARKKRLAASNDAAKRYAAELEALYNRLDNTTESVNAKFWHELTTLDGEFQKGTMTVEQYRARVEELIKQTSYARQVTQQQEEAQRSLRQENQAGFELMLKLKNAHDNALTSFEGEVEQIEFETQTMGLNNAERQVALGLRRLEKSLVDTSAAEIQNYAQRLRDSIATQEQMRDQLSIWSDLADKAAAFGKSLLDGPRAAIQSLRSIVKQFAADLIGIFAKRWILQLGASLLGGAGGTLANAAGTVGQGTVAGAVGNTLGGFLGSLGGSLLTGAGGMIGGSSFGAGLTYAGSAGVFAGAAELGGAGSLAFQLGSALPVLGAVVAGIYLLAKAFGDKGENWKGQLAFGSSATAYTSTGPFGTQGFSTLQGDDALNRQIQAFMSNTAAIDKIIAGTLTASQIQQITQNLNGVDTTRNDGQPGEFAFGKGDGTAGEQLSLEFLQHKYGIVFDTIDKTFAETIRHWTGTASDLATQITTEASILAAIPQVHLKGLDMDALRGFQTQGETIDQTFQRIAQSVAQFDSAFTADADKLSTAQTQVSDTFASLGIAVPDSTKSFYELVHSIDVSTEAGRTLVEQLLQVAPAFLTVQNAAAQAVDTFNAIAGQLSPSFGQANSRSTLEAAVQAWMNLTPANQNGWTVNSTIGNIGSLISSGQIGSALTYAQSLGGNAVEVLNQMLSAYAAWTSSMNSSTSAAGNFTSSVNGASSAVDNLSSSVSGAKAGIKDWLKGLFLDSNLSPLTPEQRLDFAHSQYTDDLMRAQKGDQGAIGQLATLAQAYLTEAKAFYGPSSQYESIFAAVTMQTGKVAGFSLSGNTSAADMKAGFGSVVDAIKALAVLTGQSNDLSTSTNSLLAQLLGGLGKNSKLIKSTGDSMKVAALGEPSF